MTAAQLVGLLLILNLGHPPKPMPLQCKSAHIILFRLYRPYHHIHSKKGLDIQVIQPAYPSYILLTIIVFHTVFVQGSVYSSRYHALNSQLALSPPHVRQYVQYATPHHFTCKLYSQLQQFSCSCHPSLRSHGIHTSAPCLPVACVTRLPSPASMLIEMIHLSNSNKSCSPAIQLDILQVCTHGTQLYFFHSSKQVACLIVNFFSMAGNMQI